MPPHPMPRPAAGPAEAWELAETVARRIQPAAFDAQVRGLGTIVVRPAAVGWFVSARASHGLSRQQADQFRDFVVVRTYLLLTQGPRPELWELSDGGWLTHAPADLAEIDQADVDLGELVPDTVPTAWV
jgi:hypothetical protein